MIVSSHGRYLRMVAWLIPVETLAPLVADSPPSQQGVVAPPLMLMCLLPAAPLMLICLPSAAALKQLCRALCAAGMREPMQRVAAGLHGALCAAGLRGRMHGVAVGLHGALCAAWATRLASLRVPLERTPCRHGSKRLQP